MDVIAFHPRFGSAVSVLIVGIQRDEYGIDIDAERQPELRHIPSYYQQRRGNFWLAVSAGDVIGTIALLDLGREGGALHKMFVHRDFRGAERGTAKRLLDVLLHWAREHQLGELYLGTTGEFLAAQRFYEKHGFRAIEQTSLPTTFPLVAVDTRFYQLSLPA